MNYAGIIVKHQRNNELTKKRILQVRRKGCRRSGEKIQDVCHAVYAGLLLLVAGLESNPGALSVEKSCPATNAHSCFAMKTNCICI